MTANTAQILVDDLFSSGGTDRYKEEYVFSFVEKWDELIDWDRRAAAEGDFFVDVLASRGVKTVLDVATGTGFHSVMLKQSGFDVTSVDGSELMLRKAAENGLRRGQTLTTIHADWRWLGDHVTGGFDAIICLGNSFTHLFADADRRQALAHFQSLLKPGGVLILDQRNYDALLDKTAQPSRKFYYCGKDVCARPIHVDETKARFRYEFSDGAAFHLEMFPLRRAYVQQLISESGFESIATYGDFKETVRESEPDFYIHVAKKSKANGKA
ncbi:MAG: class I SAM-dependent methyltransferase [Hyphomicrobiaceae bacterium]